MIIAMTFFQNIIDLPLLRRTIWNRKLQSFKSAMFKQLNKNIEKIRNIMPKSRDEINKILNCLLNKDNSISPECNNCQYEVPCSYFAQGVLAVNEITDKVYRGYR